MKMTVCASFSGGNRKSAHLLKPWLLVGLVFAGMLAIRIVRVDFPHNLGSEAVDDAYVTYRYARNIAHGLGFVFNPDGPPVLGTSTPLYTLILAGGAWLGFDIPQASQLLGMVGVAGTSVILLWMGVQGGFPMAGLVAALSWSASPFASTGMAGMETPLYAAVSLAALLAASRRQYASALALAALATLLRPDGLAVLAAIGIHNLLWRRDIPGRLWLLPVILVGSWSVYAFLRFGTALPASGLAKMSHGAAISGRFLPWSPTLLYLAEPWSYRWLGATEGMPVTVAGVVVLLASLAAGLVLGRRSAVAGLTVLWLLIYLAGYSVLQVPDFHWYYAPPAAGVMLLLWMALECRMALECLLRGFLPRVSGLATLMAGVLLMGDAWSLVPPADPHFQSAHMKAGLWLKAHAKPAATLAAYEVGKIAYASDLVTTDLLGLTEPRARQFLSRGDYAWAIREDSPDYVFTHGPANWPLTDAIFALPEFKKGYELVAVFPQRNKLDYRVYARRR